MIRSPFPFRFSTVCTTFRCSGEAGVHEPDVLGEGSCGEIDDRRRGGEGVWQILFVLSTLIMVTGLA